MFVDSRLQGAHPGERQHQGRVYTQRQGRDRQEKTKAMQEVKRRDFARKSAPRIGWSTLARRNWNWKWRGPSCRGINLEPQALVGRPSAIRRQGLSVQLRNDRETQILKLQCQLNNHSLTGHLEGT